MKTIKTKTSMRDVCALLKPDVPIDRVIDYVWRSPQEIATYLDGISIEVPAKCTLEPASLGNMYAILVQTQQRIDTLPSIAISIKHNRYKGVNDKLQDTRKRLKDTRSTVLKSLQKLASRREPRTMYAVGKVVQSWIERNLTYKKRSSYVYAAYQQDRLTFTRYFCLTELQGADFLFKDFYIALTCCTKTEQLWINTLHDFRAPGQFNAGRLVSNPADTQRILAELCQEENLCKHTTA